MRPLALRRECRLPPCPAQRGLFHAVQLVGRRCRDHRAGVGVDQQRGTVRQVEDFGVHADDERQPDRTRDDRGVRVGAAAYRHRGHQSPRELLQQVGRTDVAGDEDEPAGRRRLPGSGEVFDDPPADLPHVGGPLP